MSKFKVGNKVKSISGFVLTHNVMIVEEVTTYRFRFMNMWFNQDDFELVESATTGTDTIFDEIAKELDSPHTCTHNEFCTDDCPNLVDREGVDKENHKCGRFCAKNHHGMKKHECGECENRVELSKAIEDLKSKVEK